MTTLIGSVLGLTGVFLWLRTVKSYLDDPGYGGFDMNTAPAFDFGWFKGAVALGLGSGLMTQTWWIGIVTAIVGFLTTLLVKPVLGTAVANRIEKERAAHLKSQPPKGFKALSMIERRTKSKLGVALLILCPTLTDGQAPTAAAAGYPDSALHAQLLPLVEQFHGRVGIYVRHLGSGHIVEINADEIFPTASMIKVPIMVAVFDAIERGELEFDQKLTYTDSLLYEGEDILGSFADSSEIELSKVQMLSITTSDNTASLWLQHLAGTGTTINEWLKRNGFQNTRMNSRTPGRRGDWEVYGWGQSTPREMAGLLVGIREGRVVSTAASEAMYRHLSRIFWNGEALSQIPPWVQTASKQGAVNQSRSEVVLVNAPSGDYVFCVITKDQEDESWEPDNEGYVLLRTVSAILWSHFEPDYPWSPPAGAERYVP